MEVDDDGQMPNASQLIGPSDIVINAQEELGGKRRKLSMPDQHGYSMEYWNQIFFNAYQLGCELPLVEIGEAGDLYGQGLFINHALTISVTSRELL